MLSVDLFEVIGSFLRKYLPNTQVWITILCQLFFHGKSGQFSLQLNHISGSHLDNNFAFICIKSTLNIFPIVIHRILKGHVLKGQNLLKLVTLLLH